MKIGIDIDQVLAKQLEKLVPFYHLKTGKLILAEKFHTYYWPGVWGITLEEGIQIDQEFKQSAYFDSIEPVENAVEAVNHLGKGNQLFVITARPVFFKEKTEQWLKKHLQEIPFELIHSGDFHIANKTKNKGEICEELSIDVMIEDQDEYALQCAEKGVKVILLNKPWNMKAEHSNIIRVNNWIEVLQEIDKISTNVPKMS
ncbi:MAG TPA: hypothetical protein VJA18_07460 [Candidatus Nanoarchaeia archaeon]|nr:hypothetical protein [Candidatus Nanoarchaeia archaeon]